MDALSTPMFAMFMRAAPGRDSGALPAISSRARTALSVGTCRTLLAVGALSLITSALCAAQASSSDDGWPTGAPAEFGMDASRLRALTDAIRAHPEFNIHALLVERSGHLVYEEYFSGQDQKWGEPLGQVVFTRETKHDVRSVTKSVVSALVGLALQSGAIWSLDVPILDFFPEYGELVTPEKRRITVRHALTMTSGLDWEEVNVPYSDPKNDEVAMNLSADPIRYVLSRPVVTAPGTKWRYNGGTTQLLATIVQRATKQPLAQFARSMLFAPLGINDVEWAGDLAGVPSGASGLRLRPRDLAKFGSLYLHRGRWNGRQVLSRSWVAESTKKRVSVSIPGLDGDGYGYLWWHACFPTPSGTTEVRAALGNGEQRVFVIPAEQAVVTVLSGRYNDLAAHPPAQLLTEYILPAMPRAQSSQCIAPPR